MLFLFWVVYWDSRDLADSVGCIINVASLLGLKGGVGSVGYAASKAGVIGKSLQKN